MTVAEMVALAVGLGALAWSAWAFYDHRRPRARPSLIQPSESSNGESPMLAAAARYRASLDDPPRPAPAGLPPVTLEELRAHIKASEAKQREMLLRLIVQLVTTRQLSRRDAWALFQEPGLHPEVMWRMIRARD